MTRLTISVPDELAEMIREQADGNISAWAGRVLRNALLAEHAKHFATYEREHYDPQWAAERETMLIEAP